MADTAVTIADAVTGDKIPVDGTLRSDAPSVPGTGQSIRQRVAIGDGGDNDQTLGIGPAGNAAANGASVQGMVGGTPIPTLPLMATQNIPIAAGHTAGAAVTTPGHLHWVHVYGTTGFAATAGVSITDGPGGVEIAWIPPNFGGGDIAIYGIKQFFISLYLNTSTLSPAFSLGVST